MNLFSPPAAKLVKRFRVSNGMEPELEEENAMLQWNMARFEPPPWIELSPQAREIFSRIVGTSLISGPALSQMLDHDAPYAYPFLEELQDANLLTSVELGGLTGKSEMFYVSAYGRTFLVGEDVCWHQDGGLAFLLDRFPVTEVLPLAAASMTKMGNLTRFHWYKDVAWEAEAVYENGWALLFWSGPLERETHLTLRFQRLGPDLLEHAAPGPRPWPGLLFFVVHDRWQAELVKRAAGHFGLEDQILFWYVWDQSLSFDATPRPSRGGVIPQTFLSLVGNWRWEDRVEASLWSGGLSWRYYRHLSIVAEWPRSHATFAKDVMREGPTSRNAERALKVLRDMNRPYLAGIREGRDIRNTIKNPGYNLLARIDGVANSRMHAAVRGPAGTGNSPRHDDGARGLAAQFFRGRLDVAAGWRSRERWPGGGIEPDLIVFLTISPFGPGWVYVEWELSARYATRAEEKFLRYLQNRRQDDFGVLFVAWDDRAERHFQDLGRANCGRPLPAKLVTTTLDRLARHGALGNDRCWSWYGTPVRLG